MNKRGDSFLEAVTNHIKSKEAKKFVASELEFHLRKAKKTWIEKGLSEEDAEDKAVQLMGSPVKLGKELNKLHRPRIDWLIVILLVTAMGLGFLPIFSLVDADIMDTNQMINNKAIFVILGITVALSMMMIDYRKLKKLGWLFYTMGVLILLFITFYSNAMSNGQPFIVTGSSSIECLRGSAEIRVKKGHRLTFISKLHDIKNSIKETRIVKFNLKKSNSCTLRNRLF